MDCLCLASLSLWRGGEKGQAEHLPAVDSGQELPQLKLERPQKGKEEETEGHLARSCLPLQARESLLLWVRKDPSL